jgi:hypothetical protein
MVLLIIPGVRSGRRGPVGSSRQRSNSQTPGLVNVLEETGYPSGLFRAGSRYWLPASVPFQDIFHLALFLSHFGSRQRRRSGSWIIWDNSRIHAYEVWRRVVDGRTLVGEVGCGCGFDRKGVVSVAFSYASIARFMRFAKSRCAT